MSTDAYTATTGDVSELEAQLEEARSRKHEAEREAAAQAASARRAVWQEMADAYDPAALRDAVMRSWEAIVAAAGERRPLTGLLGEHLTAIMREARQHALASDAVAGGAMLRSGVALGPAWFRDATGSSFGEDIPAMVPALLARAIVEAAERVTGVEVQEVRDRAREAYAAGLLAEPTGYRIQTSRAEDFTDVIGGVGAVSFAGGTAYVMRATLGDERLHALVRYWRGTPGYTVTEVYDPEVPTHHVEALRRLGEPG